MRVDMTFWKPDQSQWPDAYSNQLDNATSNATYTMMVDWVDVRTIGATGAFPTGGDWLPEPSGFILLGTAAVSLLAYVWVWRRTKERTTALCARVVAE